MDSQLQAGLMSAVANGQWTQTRLRRAGLVESSECKLCGTEDGTPWHRHHCAATCEQRGNIEEDNECKLFLQRMDPAARHLLDTKALLAPIDLGTSTANQECTFE